MNKWNGRYFADLAERVGSVFVYSLIAFLTTNGIADFRGADIEQLWPVLFLPAVLALLKGLVANLANPESGASLLPSPPGPEVNDDHGFQGGFH